MRDSFITIEYIAASALFVLKRGDLVRRQFWSGLQLIQANFRKRNI